MMNQFIIRKYLVILFFLLGGIFLSQAQTIQLEFSRFAGKKYYYLLMQGDKVDTIAKGSLNEKGKATLKIPKEYKEYKGMSRWMLNDGGGLDMILNKESFSVGSQEEQPNENNIKYIGSKENTLLTEQYKKQDLLMQKTGLLKMIIQLYDPNEAIYKVLKKEQEQQEGQLQQLGTEGAESMLYASRFHEIADYVGGTVPKSYNSDEERAKDLARFVSDKVDINALYTSGYWGTLIQQWMDIQFNFVKEDTQLLEDSKKMLSRAQTGKVYDDLAQKLVALYTKFGKDLLLKELALVIKEQGRLVNSSWSLERLAYGQIGAKAPALIGLKDPVELGTGKNTLLLFYQTGCGNCEKELNTVKANYAVLKDKNIRLISIAADSDEEIYKYAAASFPWKDILWDERMFEGENFKNYGIIGTPTYILINGEGKISGKYATLEQTELLK